MTKEIEDSQHTKKVKCVYCGCEGEIGKDIKYISEAEIDPFYHDETKKFYCENCIIERQLDT